MRFQRKYSLILLAYSLIPLPVVAVICQQGDWVLVQTVLNFTENQLLASGIITFLVLAILAAAAFLGSRIFTRPLREVTSAVERLAQGDFSIRIDQRTGDERDELIQAFNDMVPKLEHHMNLQKALNLAMEVQQNLLPKTDPNIQGLDIAGKSMYHYETGGDYYDFLDIGPDQRKINVVVGDVSGHGIPSALLMASVRAAIRQRSLLSGSISQIMSDVNRQLSLDVGDSGRFVTLFYLTVDAFNRRMHWVCAGHEPAILYDPTTDTFEKLGGIGIPLGIDEGFQYEVNEKDGLKEGQIICLCTDGIVEARNSKGEMFGKDTLCDIIRHYAFSSANEILNATINFLKRFQKDILAEDDVTLVVIKVNASGHPNNTSPKRPT
jgi:sigma-B regulation protein RsbU (phosphoserine phosphatase)